MSDELVALGGGRAIPISVSGPENGPLVLLLHGFPQDRRAWASVAGPLAAHGYRVVAPDQRGYASTFRPPGVRRYVIDELVRDVLDLAVTLGRERFHVVGHDWGGLVAWALAARHGDRLESLTAVSTPHPAAFVRALASSAQAMRSLYVPFFWLPAVPERLLLAGRGEMLRTMLLRSGLPPGQAAHYTQRMRERGALTAALNWYRALPAGRLWSTPAVAVPTLYVWSTGDAALGRAAAIATERFVEAPYRFEVLDGVPHWIPEVVGPVLASMIAEHLDANGDVAATRRAPASSPGLARVQ